MATLEERYIALCKEGMRKRDEEIIEEFIIELGPSDFKLVISLTQGTPVHFRFEEKCSSVFGGQVITGITDKIRIKGMNMLHLDFQRRLEVSDTWELTGLFRDGLKMWRSVCFVACFNVRFRKGKLWLVEKEVEKEDS